MSPRDGSHPRVSGDPVSADALGPRFRGDDRKFILHGWQLSYFTGKTRSYLRYKQIPFVDHEVDALTLMWRAPRKTAATVMPVLVTPEGEWLQDTKHIVDVLERRYPRSPVVPATPRQHIAALLLEAWLDECWIPTAMHYRWSYPENYPLFERDAGSALLPWAPRFLQDRIAAYVANTLRDYLPAVGVVPEQFPVMERWTEDLLGVFEAHFAVQPFLFGGQPSIADFALQGPLYGHFSRDPWPRDHLIAPRPRVKDFVERMNAPAACHPERSEGSGLSFLPNDALPATLQPLFDAVFREFLPMVRAIRDELQRTLPDLDPARRLPRALGMIEFPQGRGSYRRAAMPYTLWMMQRIQNLYRSLGEQERGSVDAWLAEQGAPDALRESFGPPLARQGLHVRLAA